jgi:hypothetical protein
MDLKTIYQKEEFLHKKSRQFLMALIQMILGLVSRIQSIRKHGTWKEKQL